MEADDTMMVNAKTFRKIAKMIRRLVDHIRKEKSLPEKLARETFDQIDDLAKEALITPPRNCDMGTSEEQAERFENFCLKHIGCAEETGGRHCVGCPLEKASRNITQKCELYWAQTPYEAETKGETKIQLLNG